MGLYLDEGHEVVLDSGSIIAVRQGGHVEVWDGDGETHYGNLKETATSSDVCDALAFYGNGIEAGRVQGESVMQSRIRQALGL